MIGDWILGFGLVFVAAVIVLFVLNWIFAALVSARELAEASARQRYARGEINKEELSLLLMALHT